MDKYKTKKKIIEQNEIIHKKINRFNISLCRFCYKRNFNKTDRKFTILYNTYIRITKSSKKICFICKNFFFTIIPNIVKEITNSPSITKQGQNVTIDTGTILPVFFYENEDLLRSLFQIRGQSSIKNHINSTIRNELISKKNCTIDHRNPDYKFEILIERDLKFSIACKSKELYVMGRYNKYQRGIKQRIQKKSMDNNIQSPAEQQDISIEYYLRKTIFLESKSTDMVISWTGSEDKDSLVLGKGRPYIIKINNSKVRNINNYYNWEKKVILNFKTISQESTLLYPKYKLYIKILIDVQTPLIPLDYDNIKTKLNGNIRYIVKNKSVIKHLRYIDYQIISDTQFELMIILDNGIPIKKFVEDEKNTTPSLTSILGKKCKCINFDIYDILDYTVNCHEKI